MTGITDIWFRSTLPLAEIARRLGLEEIIEDSENHWSWVIGSLGDIKLDITREHGQQRWRVDTRIFLVDEDRDFSDSLLALLVGRLHGFVRKSVFCGRWTHASGNSFDLTVVREVKKAVNSL